MAHYFNDSRVPLGIKPKEKNANPYSPTNRFSSLRIPDDTSWPKAPVKIRENSNSTCPNRRGVPIAGKIQKSSVAKPLNTHLKYVSKINKPEPLNSMPKEQNSVTDIKLKPTISSLTDLADAPKDEDANVPTENATENCQIHVPAEVNSVTGSELSEKTKITFSNSSPGETAKLSTPPVYRNTELDSGDQSYIIKNEKTTKLRAPKIYVSETTDSEAYSSDATRTKILLDRRIRGAQKSSPKKSCLRLPKYTYNKDVIETCPCLQYDKSKIARRSDPQLCSRSKCCMHICCSESSHRVASESDCRIECLRHDRFILEPPSVKPQVQFEKVVFINASDNDRKDGFEYRMPLLKKRKHGEDKNGSMNNSSRVNNCTAEDKTGCSEKTSSLKLESSSARNLQGKKQADSRLFKLKITVFLSFLTYSLVIVGPMLYDWLFWEDDSGDTYDDMSYLEIATDYVLSSFQEAFGGLFGFIGRIFLQSRTCKKCTN